MDESRPAAGGELYSPVIGNINSISSQGWCLSLNVLVSRWSRDPLRLRPQSHLGQIGIHLGLSLGTERLILGLGDLGLMHMSLAQPVDPPVF